MTVSDLVWYVGFLHTLLYVGMGVSLVTYFAFRTIGGIAKVIYQHRDSAVPRFGEE